ncbi:MAG: hypothetical protein JOZ90_16230 [Alphaproteobacteria bacterium]|nr:hypothetical protein [Alphaproteobacteria bacterium]MBV9371995.1 hypothetical protein [Alphaproteobacteria bacterium]MBV9902620.1 hypothetical protein [Alphaproteobacteria bacterium]
MVGESEPTAAPGAGGATGGDAESRDPSSPSAVPPGMRARAGRDFAFAVLGAAALIFLSWFLFWPSNSASAAGLSAWNKDPSSLFTVAERQRLASWDESDFFRRGFPGPGPAPLTNPRTRSYPAVPESDTSGRHDARQRFIQVAREMAQWREQHYRTNSVAKPRQAGEWLRKLSLTEQELPTGAAAQAINYQRALIALWTGERATAGRNLLRAECPADPVDTAATDPESSARRSMRVACSWLSGRIREARQPGDGAELLRAAVSESSDLRLSGQDAQTFPVSDRDYFISFDTAHLWADYLASLLARPSATPLEKEDLDAVTTLAEDPENLRAHPELLAMVKMLLVRAGKLTELDRAKLLQAGATAPEPVKALAGAADIVAGGTDRKEAAVPKGVSDELDNWIAHNCHRRERLSGKAGQCGPVTKDFEAFEAGWAPELSRLANSTSPTLAWIGELISKGLLVLFWIYLVWCLRMLWIRRKLIVERCEEIFSSGHLADHLERPRPAAPGPPAGGANA